MTGQNFTYIHLHRRRLEWSIREHDLHQHRQQAMHPPGIDFQRSQQPDCYRQGSYDGAGNLLTTNTLMPKMVCDAGNRLTCAGDDGTCTSSNRQCFTFRRFREKGAVPLMATTHRTGCIGASMTGQNFTYIYTGDGSNGQFGNTTCTNTGATSHMHPFGIDFSTLSTTRLLTTGYSYDGAGNLLTTNTLMPKMGLRRRKPADLCARDRRDLHIINGNALLLRRFSRDSA